jgi:hypothetical protein
MNATEYADALVLISPTHACVRNYHPNGSDKLVSVGDIEWVRTRRPSIMNGRLRFCGTGSFHTWFAAGMSRPARDTMFIMKLRSTWWRIGFTVEDSARAREALGTLGVLKE